MTTDWARWGVGEREPSVLVCGGPVGVVDRALIDALKEYAASTPKRRARVLFHSADAAVQQMLIAAPAFNLWPPILNNQAPQSWVMLEGDLAFVRYRPPGEILELVRLSASNRGSPSYLRLSEKDWYTMVPLSEMAVYLEFKPGPYTPTKFAAWGPRSFDDVSAHDLTRRLSEVGFPVPGAHASGVS